MKLELKHLAPYLPYGLQFKGKFKGWKNYSGDIMHLCAVDLAPDKFDEIKPILRRLSYLTEEIEIDGKKFVPVKDVLMYSFGDITENYDWLLGNPYIQIVQLFEWHFDVFGLIEQGLAIDINTLE